MRGFDAQSWAALVKRAYDLGAVDATWLVRRMSQSWWSLSDAAFALFVVAYRMPFLQKKTSRQREYTLTVDAGSFGLVLLELGPTMACIGSRLGLPVVP